MEQKEYEHIQTILCFKECTKKAKCMVASEQGTFYPEIRMRKDDTFYIVCGDYEAVQTEEPVTE